MLCDYLVLCSLIRIFAASNVKYGSIMEVKKVTYDEALARWKHSLEIKREWERKVIERWEREDQQKVSLA